MSSVQPIAPCSKFALVTPSDTALLSYNGIPRRTKALYVGTAGNLAVKNDLGNAITLTAVPAGSVLPLAVTVVMSTNTTASTIVALYD